MAKKVTVKMGQVVPPPEPEAEDPTHRPSGNIPGSLTVAGLIAQLSKLPPGLPVTFSGGSDYADAVLGVQVQDWPSSWNPEENKFENTPIQTADIYADGGQIASSFSHGEEDEFEDPLPGGEGR